MPRDEERKREYMRVYSRRKRESEEVRARENEYRQRKRESEEVRTQENASRLEYYYKYNAPGSENYEEFRAKSRIWGSAFWERNKDRLMEKRKNRQEEIREWYRQHKTTIKCIRCGENDPACLHFHHRNSSEKKMNIATYVFEAPNLKKFIQELNKCDVLCANCHSLEHWQERNESSDLLKRENLEQQLMDTQGWYPRMKIKKKIANLDVVIWFNRYKRTLACSSCGISHPACLHFHHRDENDKYKEISNLVHNAMSIKWVMREIDKCEVLCANCHAKYHWGDINLGNFRRWPAAVRHHGAVVGGLLEHTVNVTSIAELTAHLYPCNHDMVLTGALLHDIGKLEELEDSIGSGYTAAGRMVGHIILGMQYVQRQAEGVSSVDEGMREDLLHIILAHHTKEFGSPVNPVTIEALIVHQADMTEARLTGYLEHCQRAGGSNGWTTFSPSFGGQLRTP